MAEKTKDQLAKEVESLTAELAEKNAIIEELSQKLEEKDAQKSGKKPVVTVGKKKYEVQFPKCIFNGKEVTVKDLKADPVIAGQLVEIGSAMLKEV